ncbi:universal stress protein [Sulfitobacter delicatus]|uniref:Nucleotide-binding universal stress protein, UspA family n=1 Tax=Sulfitobacter delicatus TaxID=218672 RepID=A0A1G7J966_9RHOB|nr:universal stress protein [Sulfitobacter delicatus]SDF21435.1 Nucleotide-binding universal stress protein, UspA family [Sulfitobacter delicatus]
MFDNILLTIDLSDPKSWEKALPQSIDMIRLSKGTLHILSVVPDMGTPLVEGFFPQDYEKKATARAAQELAKLVDREVPDDIKVKQHLKFGKIHREALKTIKKSDADLVVMGSEHPDKLREFLVGSNADRIVRRSPVSVLVVRA